VRLVQEREAALAKLWAEIDKGLQDIDSGRVFSEDEVFDEVFARIRAVEESQK
jgi:predicted transcriptional regulator